MRFKKWIDVLSFIFALSPFVVMGAERSSLNSPSEVFTRAESVDYQNLNGDNNLRVFPIDFLGAAFHFGYEHFFSARFAIGLEGSYMKDPTSNFFIGDSFYSWQENYAGFLAQYFLIQVKEGLFVESGANYVDVKVSSPTANNYFENKEATYLMPHASLNYRFPFKSGFNMDVGAGAVDYLGEKLTYVSRYRSNSSEVTAYSPGIKPRLRASFGYSF